MPNLDRRTALCEQDPREITGIDFIQVVDPADQTVLRVFFLIDPDTLSDPIVNTVDLPAAVDPGTVTIISVSGGESLAEVPVVEATYRQVPLDGDLRTVLEVRVAEPGDFSRYRLVILDEPDRRIDRFFNGIEFSFKQGCPADLDCKPSSECPPEALVDVPVDYLARDFDSIRGALLDFAAQRYPDWSEKIPADVGVMLAEIMAALGDELSYVQDRYAREAFLETGSQRRSLRWHTRLVDYNIHDGLSGSTMLCVQVDAAEVSGLIPAGARVWAAPGGEPPIPFEVGEGLEDQRAGLGFWVHQAWNAMPAHVPDESEPCLPRGSTELYVVGDLPVDTQLPEPPPGADPVPPETFWVGRTMVLISTPEDPSLPARRHLVRLTEVEKTTDPLCLEEGGAPIRITRIRWQDDQALPFDLCLKETVVCGNVVPATAGETVTEHFVIGGNDLLTDESGVTLAVEREGPCNEITRERTPVFLYTLKETTDRGLGWVGELRSAQPEAELQEVDPVTLDPSEPPRFWDYRRSLLESRGFSEHFVLDYGTWRRVIGFRHLDEVIEHADYASGAGFTVRFGDEEFGKVPSDGTVFRVRYRTGPGTRSNFPADSVTLLSDPNPAPGAPPAVTLEPLVDEVTNPFAIVTGVDPEDAEVIRQLAPEAYQALTFRAVRDEDYREIAERLPWVQRAGATARWTGSWLTELVTADPLGSFELPPELRLELENTLDCVRQVGREVTVRDPEFVNIDLEIQICIEPFAFAGQVKERVVEALTGTDPLGQDIAFFDPDNFTFGTPLNRANLEAAVQGVPGVLGVETVRIRARGITPWRELKEMVFEVGADQVIRLQNDPRFPERGSLRVVVRVEAPA